MRMADLPTDARGNTWFWGLMEPGENGAQLACRCPPVPEDLDPSTVNRWTKVTAGKHPLVIVQAKYRGRWGVFSFAEGV